MYNHKQDDFMPSGPPPSTILVAGNISMNNPKTHSGENTSEPTTFLYTKNRFPHKSNMMMRRNTWKTDGARLLKINPYPMPFLNGLLWHCGDCFNARGK